MAKPLFVGALPERGNHCTETGKERALREYIEALQESPGVWALWKTTKNGGGSERISMQSRGVEVTSRKREDGRVDLYVRWPEQ